MASLLTSLVGFTVPGEVLIYLRDEQTRSHLTVKNAKDRFETLPLFYDGENVSGKVRTKRLCEACVDSLACGIGIVLGCGIGIVLGCVIGIVVGCGIGIVVGCGIGIVVGCGIGIVVGCGIGIVVGCGMYILACGIGIVVGMWHGHHRRDVVVGMSSYDSSSQGSRG